MRNAGFQLEEFIPSNQVNSAYLKMNVIRGIFISNYFRGFGCTE
jgi:hypothetical protein